MIILFIFYQFCQKTRSYRRENLYEYNLNKKGQNKTQHKAEQKKNRTKQIYKN